MIYFLFLMFLLFGCSDPQHTSKGYSNMKEGSALDSLKDLSDEEVYENVKYALERSPLIGKFSIDVTVNSDTVLLSGIVDTYIEKKHAEEIVNGVIGVKHVINKLFYNKREISGDLELKQEIESQLFWNPEIESEDVIVEVVDSIVTLRGNVSNLQEVKKAEEDAIKTGAKKVINKLKIIYMDDIE